MADRGTVIRASGNRAFIMNEQCQFLEVKAPAGIQPGDQIEYLPGDIIRPGRRPARSVAVAASFIILCLIAYTAFQHLLTVKVYAYIGMEINPSIEMGINRENKVVRLKGYNEDGKGLIGSGDLLNKDINDALRTIIRECRESNYLGGKDDSVIAVSVSIPGGADGRGLIQQVDAAAKTALAENGVRASMHYFTIDESTMEQAREKDVSPLKYMLWEEAGRLGYSIPLESVSIEDPLIKEIASDREEEVVSGNAAGSEAPPSDSPAAVAVPAEDNRQGQESGGPAEAPKEKSRQPDLRSAEGLQPQAGPAEAGNKGTGKPAKEAKQTGGEARSPGSPGEGQKESKGAGGEPAGSVEGKNLKDETPSEQDKVLSQPDKAVKPEKDITITAEGVDSVADEAAGTETTKTAADGSVRAGNSSGGGGGSGGGSSGSGGKSGGGSKGGGSGGKGRK